MNLKLGNLSHKPHVLRRQASLHVERVLIDSFEIDLYIYLLDVIQITTKERLRV